MGSYRGILFLLISGLMIIVGSELNAQNLNEASNPEYVKDFLRTISNQLRYPTEAREDGLTGKVFISFNMDYDGAVSNIEQENNIGGTLANEVVRTLNAVNHGKNPSGSQKYVLAVQYVLKGDVPNENEVLQPETLPEGEILNIVIVGYTQAGS